MFQLWICGYRFVWTHTHTHRLTNNETHNLRRCGKQEVLPLTPHSPFPLPCSSTSHINLETGRTQVVAQILMRYFCFWMLQGGAKVYEADQGARLQRQECVRCATTSHRAADRPAPPPGNPAGHALLAQSVS